MAPRIPREFVLNSDQEIPDSVAGFSPGNLGVQSEADACRKPEQREHDMLGNGSRERGHSIMELALVLPWFFFLFAGVLDTGFYSYALISTESAARVAALYTSSSATTAADASGACTYALEELRMAPNVGSSTVTCGSFPVKVTAQAVTGPDGAPATLVSVTYQTVPLVPIPGILTGRLTFTRTVQMRVKG